MDFWREQIQTHWNHDGFEIRFKVVNFDEIATADLRKYAKENTIWHIRLNMNVGVIPRYKSNPLFLHPIYSGIDPPGFVHEFGHVLGLDDEYEECTKKFSVTRYIMCNPFTLGLDLQKAVYDWIATRRYAIGKDW